MGTPDFAVYSLKKLIENNYNIVGVITAVDQPAGRGKKIKMSAVKEFALEHKLNLLQPVNLKDPDFIEKLHALNADIQIVVAFRMLPAIVWDMPPFGTFNLHASLLPQYRGAAPINHAIINGETETGLTTFFLDKEIDTGKIILQEKCSIDANDDFGSLHDKMMILGAGLIIKTLELIENKRHNSIAQSDLIGNSTSLKPAPKIFKEDCKINWKLTAEEINNKIRGLSPYPTAYSYIQAVNGEQKYYVKIFNAEIIDKTATFEKEGMVESDKKNYIHVKCKNGYISIKELQIEGKKRMSTQDFLRGFDFSGKWSF
jgi:methionyl-tRNA formyltransferase